MPPKIRLSKKDLAKLHIHAGRLFADARQEQAKAPKAEGDERGRHSYIYCRKCGVKEGLFFHALKPGDPPVLCVTCWDAGGYGEKGHRG